MSSKTRTLGYAHAINEALHQLMEADPSVFLVGQGVKSPWYVGHTADGLLQRFGPERVIDTPVSENAVTGAAVGAAIAGMRAVVVHPRVDFMMYALDPILNEAANWNYMCGGRGATPVVFWGIINRGGEQAAQHSQALHALFAHAPGLKVVMPATPYDAKGLMVSAVRDDNPVVFMDDRWLYGEKGAVPEKLYGVPIGRGAVRVKGDAVTVVSLSYMAKLGAEAVRSLAGEGVRAELIDLRSAKPWDEAMVLESVHKTRRLVVLDGGWRTCGFAAEVVATVAEKAHGRLAAPVRRVTLPDVPAPAARTLEAAYYPDAAVVAEAIRATASWR